MYEQPQLGLMVVVAIYAIAGALAIIGGVMAFRARRRHREKGKKS